MHISTVVSLSDYAISLYPELIEKFRASDHPGVSACMALTAEQKADAYTV